MNIFGKTAYSLSWSRPGLFLFLVLAIGVSGCQQITTQTDPPKPTEHWLDEDAEAANKTKRKEYFEMMHRTAPGVDWRVIERDNGLTAMARKEQAIMNIASYEGTGTWRELGSRNLAGRMHSAAWSPDGLVLYSGSDRGGLWMGNLDGTGWTPLGDNLYGGVYEVGVVPADGGNPDILIRLYGDMIHRSTDQGVTWTVPAGLDGVSGTKRILVLDDIDNTVFLLVRQGVWRLLISTDKGASFTESRQMSNEGDIWTPRTHTGAVFVVDNNQIYKSNDAGGSWIEVGNPIPGATGRAVLAGSENPKIRFNVAMRVYGVWELWRSEDTGDTWSYIRDLEDFWESLVASTQDPDLIAYAGVEMFFSRNGGSVWEKANEWWQYYDDPANLLHADIPGLFVIPDASSPTGETWYIGTDGGLYESNDQMATVWNLSMSDLGVSQYYSVMTSRRKPNIVLAGSQDQGYQRAVLDGPAPPPPGPWADFDQLISGDYGHLTSSNGAHDLVYSVYPGFVLVQSGEDNPNLVGYVDFPPGESHLWMPYIQADPTDPTSFFFCATKLYRYTRVAQGVWSHTQYSSQNFSPYLTAIAFSPIDLKRVWAVTSNGLLFYSTDGAVTWTQSTDTGPGSHYFYGTVLVPSSTDENVCWVGGSGYSNAPVMRTTDGGTTWTDESVGLPSTLVYCMVEAPDGSGMMFCGSENGAWGYDPVTRTWSDLLGTDAPINTYWTCEAVPSENLVRFGTYGRGIWDYSLNTPGYFPYGELLDAPNILELTNGGRPFIGQQTTFTIDGCRPWANGILVLSTEGTEQYIFGGIQLVEMPAIQQFPFQADGDGIAEVTFNIPDNPSHVEREFYFQAGARDAGQVEGWALSNGLRAVVGE
jgi:photosystem II stability/assembly factor-like uncharacterized protein